jgi:hypothetical protein
VFISILADLVLQEIPEKPVPYGVGSWSANHLVLKCGGFCVAGNPPPGENVLNFCQADKAKTIGLATT